jgi:hypothetical protein
MSAYIKSTERSQINNLLHLKLLEKQEQAKPKTSKREIMKMETIQRPYKKINETKSWFFEKINNINKPLANLTKMRKEET